MKYGILGSGDATASAVHECLMDILKSDKDASFLVHSRRKPQGAVTHVYDFIVDNEVPFVSYTRVDDNAPKPLTEGAQECHTTDDPLVDIIKASDTILLLWDEENNESSEKIAIRCADAGKEILDLTMALTPVVVNGADKKESEVPFTREELEEMPVGVLRNQAKAVGLDMGKAKKEDIIEALLGTSGSTAGEETPPPSLPHTPPANYAVIVWHENGMMQVAQVPVEQAKELLS